MDNSTIGSSLADGLGAGHRPDDVRVPGVGDGERADPEVLSAGGAQLDVVARVVVHARLGQHGVVLDLRLSEGRRVAGDDYQLGLAAPQRLEGLLVAQHVLAGLHHEGEPRIDGLVGLLLLLLSDHCGRLTLRFVY